MRFLRSRIFLALVSVVVVAAGLFLLQYVLRVRKLATLQRAFSATMVFPECHEPTGWIPASFDAWIHERCESWTKNRGEADAFIQRLRFFAGARIDIVFFQGAKIPDDPAAALHPFAGLQCVGVNNTSRSVASGGNAPLTTTDALRLCTTLRSMPGLRAAYLLDPAFNDDGITPLAGHPNLGLVHFGGTITPRSIPLFRSLPSLFAIGLTEDTAIVRREDGDAILKALGPGNYRINWMDVEPP